MGDFHGAYNVTVIDAAGAHLAQIYRVPRDVAEKIVVGILFDTAAGIGMGGVADPRGYLRVCVSREDWPVRMVPGA